MTATTDNRELRALDTSVPELDGMTVREVLNAAGFMLDDMQAIVRALLTRTEAGVSHRWDIERDGDDLLVCEGDHHRSEGCSFVR